MGLRQMVNMKQLGAAVAIGGGLIVIFSFAAPYTPASIRSDLAAETAARMRLENVVAGLAKVVELQAIIASEPPTSDEFREARAELRRLRRVRLALEVGGGK